MKRNKNKPKFINRCLSAVLSAVLFVTGVPFPAFTGGFHFEHIHLMNEQVALADDVEPAGITVDLFNQSALITLNSPADLKNFSWWYNKYGDSNSTINVNIAITTASTYNAVNFIDIHEGFASIGTDTKPFNGTITLTNASLDTFYLFKPFFGTVNQSTRILDEGGSVRNIKFLCSMGYTGDSYAMPASHAVLAKKIVNTSPVTATQMECSVELTTVSAASGENVKEKDISGIVGTIDSGSSVKINLTNNGIVPGTGYIVDVTGSGPIGLLCDTMKTNSVLTANIVSGATNTTYNVTSSDGPAGGLVGTMESGAALILPDGGNAGFASVAHTISGTYCGNLVGSAENAYIGKTVPTSVFSLNMTIGSAVKISSAATLDGASGNGHLFGYYKVSDETVGVTTYKNCTITLNLSNMSVKATKGNAGGLIGVLDFASTAETSASDSPVFTINGGAGVTDDAHTGTKNLTLTFSGTNNGGLIGVYKTSSLNNTLSISDVYTSLSGTAAATVGGLIGKIDDTNSAAYVKIEKAHTAGSKGGGLVGTAGGTNTKGAFVELLDYNKVDGGSTAGIIATMAYGVLRLAGTTDLTGLSSGNMILNSRDTALVYSNGTGNNTAWTLKRPNISYDDIGTWGEVFRLTGVIGESSFASAHTVSIPAAPISTENTEDSNPGPIATLSDFAKLALNIQHNTGNTSAVLIMDTANTSKSSHILDSDIYLSGTFNLSGTGITGLTRDGGSSEQVFSGSLTGGTVQLAVGEHYGNNDPAEGNGRIYRHRWNGLFSAISGATISDLTVSGTCDKEPASKENTSYFGGVAGKYEGSTATSLTNVTSTVSCSIPGTIDSSISVVGGMIGGVADDATGMLSFNGCNSSAKIADGTGVDNYFGGYIALVDRKGSVSSGSIPTITINFGNTAQCTVGGGAAATPNYSNSTAKTRPLYGGLIGVVRGTNAHSIATTVNVTNVEASNLIINSSLTGISPNGAGGLLGYAWYDAEVSIPRLAVSGSSVTATGGSGDLGGLVYAATGHWTVCGVGTDDKVTIASSTFSGSGSLGLLVTRAFNEVQLGKDTEDYTADKQAALYLELTNQVKYDPSSATISGSPSVFDEIVAYSVNPSDSIGITDNGNAIVSINTDGAGIGLIMTGSACNTYQNKTAYGKSTVKTNENTRYYYNLDTIRGGSPSDAEKLLLWSVQQYAHLSIARHNYFGTSFTPSGTALDMTGLSYYTIDYAGSFPFSGRNFTLTFYNKEIETGEGVGAAAGNTDGNVRSTVSASSQHYMMHCGLFRNVPANSLTLGNVTLSGNVGKYNGGSGFIISGKLGGDASVTSQFSDTGITLSGAYIYTGSTIGAGDYAPLLINTVGKNANLKIKNVSSTGYTSLTGFAATSLIGKVGADDASDSNMNIEFDSITLDARKTANAISTDFNTAYGSTKSIFSNATLLQQYIYSGTDSKGVYNYRWEEDWTNNQHHVTYGAEIDNTVDHKDATTNKSEQRNYFGSDKFTHPTNNAAASEYGQFAANFIPYVYNIGSSNSDNIHELRVNIPVVNLTEGCGTYNDPYVIKTPKQLYAAADLIRNENFTDTSFQINLPSSIADNLHWCNPATGDTKEHKVFQLNNASTPQFANGGITHSRDDVRKYLAGAYYLIEEDLTLTDFPGLGAGTTGDYAFRGVVVGKNDGTEEAPDYPSITLPNGVSFVYNSNGCVIKNLDFVKGTIAIGDQNEKAQFQYNGGCKAYGGIIDKIMGGDNIIDHVGITYNSTVTSGGTGDYLHTIPIGGYVGVILNGGLFFRNMDDVEHKSGITAFSAAVNKMYLYRNPIIGRVLNGYAVCEDCDELVNGDKNYYISKLTSYTSDPENEPDKLDAATKLKITSNAINAYDAQSWFVLSLLVNSGTLSDKTLYINSDSKARHMGAYDDVGCLNTIAKNAADFKDKALFVSGYSEVGTSSATVKPYLLEKYTADGTWLNTTSGYAITMSGGTWNLPKGYRGIGGFNVYDSGTALTGINTDCNIKVSAITPNETEIVVDMSFKTYRHNQNNYTGPNKKLLAYLSTKDNYSTSQSGFGLFNTIIITQAMTVTGLTVTGNVFSDYYDEATGEIYTDYGYYNETVAAGNELYWPNQYACTVSQKERLSCGLF
ncbi:MAG: hypothetical protein IK130_11530, partial [Oscillospiraceae bacterium]|nr:hypothetical protein [Oscillospiraceae bacterium]